MGRKSVDWIYSTEKWSIKLSEELDVFLEMQTTSLISAPVLKYEAYQRVIAPLLLVLVQKSFKLYKVSEDFRFGKEKFAVKYS